MTRIEDRTTGHLVVTRLKDQRVRITTPSGEEVWVQVLEVQGGKVRLGFLADRDVIVLREEVIDRPGTSPGGGQEGGRE